MQTCYITFMSQTKANQLRKLAHKSGLFAQVVQTPRQISREGCSYSIKCDRKDLSVLISLSQKNKVSYSRIFLVFFDPSGERYFEEF